MRLKWMSHIFMVFGLFAGLMGLVPSFAFAAESAALLSHSLQDDYGKSISAQQSSVLSLQKYNPDSHKNYDLAWSLAMIEKVFENPLNKQNLLIMKASISATYHVNPVLSLNVTPLLSYFTGYTQTQNEVQGNNSVWTMKNATLDYKPWAGSLFSIGALNQQKNTGNQQLHTAMLMDDRSFPGIEVQLGTTAVANHGSQFGLLSELAVPSSASLTTQTGDQEPTPSFASAGAYLNYKNSRVKASLSADYFSFNNLPSSIAMQSGLLGNTVIAPNGQANSTDNVFAYSYHGVEANASGSVIVTNYWRLNADGIYIQNTGAPSGENTAIGSSLSAEWIAARDIILMPAYIYYKAESDAAVASYNDSDFMPNMAGYWAKFSLRYKSAFKASLYGGERAPLVENPNQFHEHFYGLKLEILNVAI